MAELDRFEARLAASLERLADEVPTTVDAGELTAAIAAAGAQRGWLRQLSGAWLRQRTPALRLALVLAALLALTFGLLVLAPRLLQSPFEPMVHGRMTCPGPAWTLSARGPVTLACTSALPDQRLSGGVTITLGEPTSVGGTAIRPGRIDIDATGAKWSGALEVTTSPNGMAVGDAVLAGAGAGEGVTVSLHLLSADGVDWGLLGWPGTDQ